MAPAALALVIPDRKKEKEVADGRGAVPSFQNSGPAIGTLPIHRNG